MGNRLPTKILPYSAIYIDLNFELLTKNLKQFVMPTDRKILEEHIQKIFIKNREQEHLFVNLSVRTAFDLLLRSLEYPIGSEIIMTSINIPQMAQIIRYHGLVPIPLEIDQQTLLPSEQELEKSITPKTKAIMVSALFGSIIDMEMIIKIAKKHKLFLIEDAAESFIGPQYNGHPQADFTCFSFGTIKNYTAFGGAISILRNHESVYRKMKQILESYPIQSNKFYIKKYLKGIFASILLSNKPIQIVGKRLTYFFGIQHQEFVVSLVRGFEIHNNFLETFRFQIPTPMMALILLRLAAFDQGEFTQDTKKQMRGLTYLKENNIGTIGTQTKERYFWLFPILVPDKELCLRLLQKRGIEPYTGATQLRLIQNPHGSKYKYPQLTDQFFQNVLYLPISKGVKSEDIMQIVKEVVEVVNEIKNSQSNSNLQQSKL